MLEAVGLALGLWLALGPWLCPASTVGLGSTGVDGDGLVRVGGLDGAECQELPPTNAGSADAGTASGATSTSTPSSRASTETVVGNASASR